MVGAIGMLMLRPFLDSQLIVSALYSPDGDTDTLSVCRLFKFVSPFTLIDLSYSWF